MRRKMFESFISVSKLHVTESILDVGVTSDRTYASSNYLEAWYANKENVTAVGLDEAGFLEQQFPGVRFVQANGKALPFRDNTFDVVHSSAVIEHVGSRAEQTRFISELFRVSRRVTCLTTPNRWFPIEVHTGLPLVHWLPKQGFRAVLRSVGLPFFADEGNLNLLGAAELRGLCAGLDARQVHVRGVRLGGWTSNLILFLWK